MGYIGFILDRLNNSIVAKTRCYYTWEEAHHMLEKLAKRKGLYKSNRYSLVVN